MTTSPPSGRTRSVNCPACGASLSAWTATSKNSKSPEPGDTTLCAQCGTALVFTIGQGLSPIDTKKLPQAEQEEIRKVRGALAAVRLEQAENIWLVAFKARPGGTELHATGPVLADHRQYAVDEAIREWSPDGIWIFDREYEIDAIATCVRSGRPIGSLPGSLMLYTSGEGAGNESSFDT